MSPKFFFVLTLAYTGSTVLAKVLNTAPKSMILNRQAEGRRLVEELQGKDRWDPDKAVDWTRVKAAWLEVYERVNAHVETIEVVIEKSPPNLVRVEQLAREFPGAPMMVYNRDPYAFCASHLRHHHSPKELSDEDFRAVYERIANRWVKRSSVLMHEAKKRSLLMFTYEQFCEDPGHWLAEVAAICPELAGANPDAVVRVKRYEPQPVINQNPRQVSWLREQDVATITSVLEPHSELLEFFGYELRGSSSGGAPIS